MYDNGEGVPKDEKQAVAWYKKAADQGYAQAQLNIGSMYDNGEGVQKDYKQDAARLDSAILTLWSLEGIDND
jgi:TPR repeat protein